MDKRKDYEKRKFVDNTEEGKKILEVVPETTLKFRVDGKIKYIKVSDIKSITITGGK